jgi:hypothetical protein
MKRKLLIIGLTVLMLVFAACSAHALEATGFAGKDYYTWYGTTADNVTVSWDQPEGYISGDGFEIQIKNPERSVAVNIPETTALTKTFKCPKTGHWTVHVRSKRLTNGTWQYSTWADSIDPAVAKVNGQPRAWWLFVWIAGPGPISEEKQTGNHKNVLTFKSLGEMDNFFASVYIGGN